MGEVGGRGGGYCGLLVLLEAVAQNARNHLCFFFRFLFFFFEKNFFWFSYRHKKDLITVLEQVPDVVAFLCTKGWR